jgi:hypothetical protein
VNDRVIIAPFHWDLAKDFTVFFTFFQPVSAEALPKAVSRKGTGAESLAKAAPVSG